MEISLPNTACTGCGACLQTCKLRAINVEIGEDGFGYPRINTDKCVKCGQCVSVCHALNNTELMNRPSECYAAQVKDKDVLFKSTSGGLFYAFALSVLNRNGAIYGCIFDEEYNAKIVRAETLEQIEPMHGSKYVWSDSCHSYPQVKQDLEDERIVLYTCLPCQAAGLRKYLKKEYDNLYIADVLCGGAPSPYAFQMYLQSLIGNVGRENLNFRFRDKERFGSGVDCTYYLKSKKHFETWLENSFYFAFSSKSRVTWRKSCCQCNYKSLKRVSDITIGDYWGVEKYHNKFNPKDGVSLVLINTEKGSELFRSIEEIIDCEKSDPVHAIERNSLVVNANEGHHPIPAEREEFFQTLHNGGWREADKKFLKLRRTMLFKQKIAKFPLKLRQLIGR